MTDISGATNAARAAAGVRERELRAEIERLRELLDWCRVRLGPEHAARLDGYYVAGIRPRNEQKPDT